ncbi:MAG: diadenylate cyclase CdaA [Polyangiaceae bacterium]|nr:diadenylate cyclase CdaA [Polyangiaceae bacterium]
MLEGVLGHLVGHSPLALARDAIDIFLVYYIIYRALLVLRGTRAVQVGIGLGMVFVLYIVARLLELVTLLSIMGAVVSSILLIIVVVFQNDIRRFLHRVGSNARFGSLARAQETRVIDQVVDAATDLARHRTGAIIAFEQDANLDEFVGVHKGHDVDAAVTKELLVSLFIPEAMNKLHDGAVIIRSLRIAKAGVFFPMPENRVVDESFGSRHRAALGITEETDAVVVVVSEERGSISFCFNGNIASNLDGPKLRTMLEAIFSPKVRKKHRRAETRKPMATPMTGERSSRESDVVSSRTPAELEGSRSVRNPDTEPAPPSRRARGPGAPSEQPPPLRARGADGTEAIHSTGRSADFEAWRSPRAPDSESLEPRRPRHESDPPPPLRSRARADGNEASHITGRQPRLLATSQSTLTPLTAATGMARDMPKSASLPAASLDENTASAEPNAGSSDTRGAPERTATAEASSATSTPASVHAIEGDSSGKTDSQREER